MHSSQKRPAVDMDVMIGQHIKQPKHHIIKNNFETVNLSLH